MCPCLRQKQLKCIVYHGHTHHQMPHKLFVCLITPICRDRIWGLFLPKTRYIFIFRERESVLPQHFQRGTGTRGVCEWEKMERTKNNPYEHLLCEQFFPFILFRDKSSREKFLVTNRKWGCKFATGLHPHLFSKNKFEVWLTGYTAVTLVTRLSPPEFQQRAFFHQTGTIISMPN